MKYFLVIAAICFIYLPWFQFSKTLSSGDWPYLYLQNIQAFKIPTEAPFLWLEPYYQITAKLGVQVLNFSWETTEKIFWFIPFLIISIFSSRTFTKYVFEYLIKEKNNDLYATLGSFIFTANTYILMLVGGGQMGIGLSYSLSPLLLYLIFRIINSSSKIGLEITIYLVVILSIQLMLDPRIFLLTLIIAFFYILFRMTIYKTFYWGKIKIIFLSIIISILINLFWILPNATFYYLEYSNIKSEPGVTFLSFANFPNTISLLHPNWPENIFGKVGFMKPEFILIGVIAYSSLLFVEGKEKNQKLNILFFSFLGILAAFMAKGINPPFGQLYSLLSIISGSGLFRDPTKFYVWIVLSYSILIPFSIYSLNRWLREKTNKYLSLLFLISCILFLLFLIRPAIFHQLNGTFKPTNIPNEYVNLKNYLINDKNFSYALWVPRVQRFGFVSKNHPVVNADDLFHATSLNYLLSKIDNKQIIIENKIKYIIVPYDSKQEIFINDRKYNNLLYLKTVKRLRNIRWIKYINSDEKFGKIAVFEVIN